MCRNQCSECPYKVDSKNNKTLLEFVSRTKKPHKCHMIDSNIWVGVNDKNICVGYKEENE